MAKKNKNDYFELATQQVEYCVQAATLLEEILTNFSGKNIPTQRERMHAIENKADELHHDILTRLTVEFITPIDQEDILHFVQIVDDITDAIDEVVLDFYMYHIEETPAAAPAMAELVKQCVEALYEATKELKNFKKPDTLRKLLVEVNNVEGRADAAYAEALHNLFAGDIDARMLIGHRAVYERMEKCCDLCEHAADVVEQIIIKNT